jgi:hypothetical protein
VKVTSTKFASSHAATPAPRVKATLDTRPGKKSRSRASTLSPGAPPLPSAPPATAAVLTRALDGGYKFEISKQNNLRKNLPRKDEFSHVADALQYACLACQGSMQGDSSDSRGQCRKVCIGRLEHVAVRRVYIEHHAGGDCGPGLDCAALCGWDFTGVLIASIDGSAWLFPDRLCPVLWGFDGGDRLPRFSQNPR